MAHGMGGDKLSSVLICSRPASPGEGPEPAAMRLESAPKPPYRVPTMAEIAATPPNGLDVVSTFSGCGGSCLGYRMAGFRVLWASEFVPAARETYRANHPETILDERDVRQVKGAEILGAIGRAVGDVDLLDGSPPCASFSTAGKRSAGWGRVKDYSDVRQRTDDLFFEYARLLGEIRPRTFVAENVSGLVKGVAKGYFLEILRALKAHGYRVAARVLDAQWLGVPQARQRLIFVGVRDDLGLEPVFPRPLPYRYSVRDALPWISGLRWDSGGQCGSREFDVTAEPMQTVLAGGGGAQKGFTVEIDRPAPTVMSHNRLNTFSELSLPAAAPPPGDGPALDRFAIGREWDKLKPGEQSDRYFNLIRAPLDGPSPTITQTAGSPGAAGVTHPTEKRKFTIAELRRICAFPDDFALTGTYSQQWERLGRAVPPVMMRAVAEVVRDEVLARAPRAGTRPPPTGSPGSSTRH
jgi:DNA (cytosine-5)-methyltransferase 1